MLNELFNFGNTLHIQCYIIHTVDWNVIEV